MHFEPIFKEGVITVDNVRTVKALQNAYDIYKNNDHLIAYQKANSEISSLRKKVEEIAEISCISVKYGHYYIGYSGSDTGTFVLRESLVDESRKDNFWRIYQEYSYTSLGIYIHFPKFNESYFKQYQDKFNQINSFLSIAKQAIYPFAVKNSEAMFFTECEELTEESFKEQLQKTRQRHESLLDELQSEFDLMKKMIEERNIEPKPVVIVKSPDQPSFPENSIIKSEGDVRTVWQWICGIFKGEK